MEGVAQDITERNREEALRESEQWFRTLANTMPQLVWTADPDGRVDYYNERYREYSGIEPTADGGFRWAPVLHPDDVAPTVEAWERAVRTGQTYQIEHRVQRADGSYHWHLSRGMPVRDNDGRSSNGSAPRRISTISSRRRKDCEADGDAGEPGSPAHGGAAVSDAAAPEADAGAVPDGGSRAQTSGGHPARRSAAAACRGEVPPGPAEQSDPGRRLPAADRGPARPDADQRDRDLAKPVARAEPGHAVPGRSERDARVAGQPDPQQARPGRACARRRRAQSRIRRIEGLSLQGGPGDALQRGQARPGQEGRPAGAADRPIHLPGRVGPRPRVRSAGTQGGRRIRIVQHPRAGATAGRPDEDPAAPRARAARSSSRCRTA